MLSAVYDTQQRLRQMMTMSRSIEGQSDRQNGTIAYYLALLTLYLRSLALYVRRCCNILVLSKVNIRPSSLSTKTERAEQIMRQGFCFDSPSTIYHHP